MTYHSFMHRGFGHYVSWIALTTGILLPLGAVPALAQPAWGQSDVAAPTEPPSEPLSPHEPSPVPPPSDASTVDPPTVTVTQIQVQGSTVFSAEDLAGTVAPFVGQSLTPAQLEQVADAVTSLYVEAGYLTSQAVVPNQQVVDGVLVLQVIEGRLSTIQVEGDDRLTAYITQRLAPATDGPFNQVTLEGVLRQLQIDPLIETIDGQLQAGEALGESELVVTVVPAPTVGGRVAVDNLSPRSVGRIRTGGNLQFRNLAGLGDQFALEAFRSTTGGSQTYDLSYRIPVSPQNGTLLLRTAFENFRVTDPQDAAFLLGTRGNSETYEVAFRQPLVSSFNEEFALSLGFRHRNGSTLLFDILTPPSITSVVSFGQDYLRRDEGGLWVANSQFNLGTGLLDATTGDEPNSQFFSWLGQVQRFQVLSPDSLLVIQASAQLTPDSLPGSEQFFVGGGQSVRGYYENARFGDSGLRLSIEDRITVLREEEGQPLVEISPFLDLGYVWAATNATALPSQNFLLGTGIGVDLYPLPGLTASLDFGYPLVTLDELNSDRPSGLQVHFDVGYQF